MIAAAIYAAHIYDRISFDPGTNSDAPAAEYKLSGSAPLRADSIQITRNGQVWNQPVTNGRFEATVPLVAGVNHIQASFNGKVSRRIDVNGAPPISNFTGDCKGTIVASPTSGFDGDPVSVTITIDPSSTAKITRVVTHNPLCPNCDALQATKPNEFVLRQYYSGGGNATFQVQFDAYDAQNKIRCSGATAPLTVYSKP